MLEPLSVFVLGSLVISTLAAGMLFVWRYILPHRALLIWGLAQAVMVVAGGLFSLRILLPGQINTALASQVLYVGYALPWLAASYYVRQAFAFKPVLLLLVLVSGSAWYAYLQDMTPWFSLHGSFLASCLFAGTCQCLASGSNASNGSRKFVAAVFRCMSLFMLVILICQIVNMFHFDPELRERLAGMTALVLLFGNLCWGIGVMLMLLGDVVSSLKQSEAEARIAATAMETHIGVIVTDHQQRILKVNAAVTELMGYEGVFLLGKTPKVLASGRYEPPFYQQMHQCLAERGLWEGELYNRCANGELVPLWVTITALTDPNGVVQHFVGTYTDIRQRKQDEARLLSALQVAQAATRAKSAFLANMSHEIRTPMNAIIGFSELSLAENADPKIQTNLQHIRLAARSLLEIINDILDLSKIESGKLELEVTSFNLTELLSTLLASAELMATTKGLSLSWQLDTELPRLVQGDPVRLLQVLTNLLNNAIKFTAEGEVCFEIVVVEQAEQRVQMEFRVSDTGIGISEEQLQRLFQPFVQAESSTTRQYGGTGLGLAISHNLVQMMGGSFEVKSELHQGSCFTVKLNLALGQRHPISVAPMAVSYGPRYQGQRVLLVEDNKVNQLLAIKVLQKLGLEVELAENGQQALDTLRSDANFSVVLMDLQMPIMDGLEATRRLRQLPNFEHLVIIAMTANAFEEDRLSSWQAGMNDFISKPFELALLVATLDRWLLSTSSALAQTRDMTEAE